MSTLTDADFWLNEATAEDDICDKSLSVDDFLDIIQPEIPKNSRSILEIGCGIGRLTKEIKKLHPKAFVSGTDINPDFLKLAEGLSGYRADKKHPFKYPFYYLRDNIVNIPAQDFIYSVLLFQHLNNEAKSEYIYQASQALKSGGVFLFQYVEGEHSSRAMYDVKSQDVNAWCEGAGLKIIWSMKGLINPRWVWVKTER